MPDSWHVWNKKIYVVYLLVPGSVVKHNNNNKSNQTDSVLFTCQRDKRTSQVWCLIEGKGQLVTHRRYLYFHSASGSISGKRLRRYYLIPVLMPQSSCYSYKERGNTQKISVHVINLLTDHERWNCMYFLDWDIRGTISFSLPHKKWIQ